MAREVLGVIQGGSDVKEAGESNVQAARMHGCPTRQVDVQLLKSRGSRFAQHVSALHDASTRLSPTCMIVLGHRIQGDTTR